MKRNFNARVEYSHPGLFLFIFRSFKTQILQKNCRRQWDLNLDRQSIR